MAKSTLIPFLQTETVVSLFAHTTRRTEPRVDDDSFLIQVNAQIILHHPSNIIEFLGQELEDSWITTKSFNLSCRDFSIATESEQRDMLWSLLVKDLDLPFDLTKETNLLWGFSCFVREETKEGITDMLSLVARDGCHPENKIMIRINKLVNLTLDEYQMLLKLNKIITAEHHLLSDWFVKNLNNLVNLDTSSARYAREALFSLYEADNMLLGLKSVEVKDQESSSLAHCCAICMNDFTQGEISIGMPCSHFFHGFCILAWINRRKTCPICRFKLLNPSRLN